MSLPSDAGVCKHCGAILQVEKMRQLEVRGAVAFDDHVCPDCDDGEDPA